MDKKVEKLIWTSLLKGGYGVYADPEQPEVLVVVNGNEHHKITVTHLPEMTTASVWQVWQKNGRVETEQL